MTLLVTAVPEGRNDSGLAIYCLGFVCQATITQSLRDEQERQTPNAKRASSNPLARFRKSIKGDRKDDNDADNDLLNVG